MALNWPSRLPQLFNQSSSTRLSTEGEPIPRLTISQARADELAVQTSREVFGEERRLQAHVLEQQGLFSSLHLRDNRGWTELVVRFFPYGLDASMEAWGRFSMELLEFEEHCWKAWEQSVAQESSGGPVRQMVFGAGPWERKTLPRTLRLNIGGHEVPALARRFIPWPSLREAALPRDRVDRLIRSFYEVDLGRVIPTNNQLDPIEAADFIYQTDGPIGPEHVLTNGFRLVPTRWRSFTIKGHRVNLEDFLA